MKWKLISEKVPEPDKRLIAMSADSDIVETRNFGKDYALFPNSWEGQIRYHFKEMGLTHWLYSKDIQPCPPSDGE